MIGHSHTLLAAGLTATALLTASAVQAHTGNQMYDTLELLTGYSPERTEPMRMQASLPLNVKPKESAAFYWLTQAQLSALQPAN